MGERYLVANWKMHHTVAESRAWVAAFRAFLPPPSGVQVVVCPPFTALAAMKEELEGLPVALGAQNLHWEDKGAFTGEVSGPMLVEHGCRYVIVGHSERRTLAGETDQEVGRKLRAALRHGLTPILCVGEGLEERDRRETRLVLRRQYGVGLKGLGAEDVSRLIIAYEPVWAIGTGRAATPGEAAEAAAWIREGLGELYGREVAERIPVLYGGSVSPRNVQGFWRAPGIDGCLVGGASLEAERFAGLFPREGSEVAE